MCLQTHVAPSRALGLTGFAHVILSADSRVDSVIYQHSRYARYGGESGNFQRMKDWMRRIMGDPAMYNGTTPNETVFVTPDCRMSDSRALQGSVGSKVRLTLLCLSLELFR